MIKKLDGAKSLSDKAFVEGDPDAYSHLLDLYQKIESPLLDAIRIIVCFENYFKAMLLFENYAIHQMDLRVCREHFPQFLTGVNQKNLLQKTTPISLIDIKRAENHDLAWSVQSFRSLNNQTIQFSTLIKQPKYREVYSKGKEIDNQLFPLLAMLNETRNSLHLLNVEYVASGGIPVDSFLFLRDYVSAHIDAFGEEFYKGSESLIRTGKMLIETLDPEQL